MPTALKRSKIDCGHLLDRTSANPLTFDGGGNAEGAKGVLAALRPFELRNRLGEYYRGQPRSVVFFPYELREDTHVTLRIVDTEARPVLTLVDEVLRAGEHVAAADISEMRSGTYACVMTAGTTTEQRSFRVE